MPNHYDTEIVYGLEAIIERTLSRLSKANSKIDVCISGAAVAGIVKAKPIFDITVWLKKKGVKIRYVTDITSQNLPYVKDLMKTAEFKHMDGIKGNYSIVDGVDYQATAAVDEGQGPTESVLSTARAFVDQQTFVFDMLWKKAIPARQRISEIEEGLKREFIETIQEQTEIRKIITDLISSAVEEINIVLPSKNPFLKLEKENLLNLLKQKISQDQSLSLKILSDQYDTLKDILDSLSIQHPNLRYGFFQEKIQSQVIIITTDGEYVIAIESRQISNKGEYNMDEIPQLAIAIYSNSKYTVMTYESIFETLWTKAEIKEYERSS
jgi:hypothetical protein